VSEADGSPFLASQLSVLALSELGETRLDAPEVLTIESLVARRTAVLSEAARTLLNVLAVAGRPLPLRLALQLSAAESRTRATVHELSGLGLIRSRISEGERLLAVYHDRLREALLASIGAADRSALERQLLEALTADASADPAWLHALALSCGAREAALSHGVVAAERAFSSLAFERAAELYRACLALTPGAAGDLALWRRLALCLAHCGRGRQAAAAYRAAAALAEGRERLQLERSAASHLLRSGAFEEGEALLEEVLAEAGLETPTSEPALIAAVAWERARLGLRSLTIEPRSADELPPERFFEGYLCGTLSIELQPYDPLRAALFQARSLRLALDSRVPELLARALCVAATLAAVSSSKDAAQRAESLLARADALEQTRPSPLVRSNICSARAVCSLLRGRMRETVEYSDEAERTFREDSSSDEAEYYHRFTVISSRVSALFELGEAQQAQHELARAVQLARATENVAALLMLSSVRTRAELALNQAERARLRLEGERAQLPSHRFGLLHAIHIGCVLRVGCATGEHAWALDRTRALAERMEHSVLRRGGPYAFMTFAAHCRLLLNQALATGLDATAARRAVQPDMRRLAAATQPAAAGVLSRTRARLALMEGDRERARAELQRSLACFERLGVRDEAARDRYACGALLGPEGQALQRSALAALRAHGYVHPEGDLGGYYPELVGRLDA
jgi:tetratricopeptide (TPR) repeat protein